VSSTSRLDVVLSDSARTYLLSLPKKEAQSIALHLLTLYKNGTPKHSRVLRTLDGEKSERVWIVGKYEILYVFVPEARRVEVGVIRPKQT